MIFTRNILLQRLQAEQCEFQLQTSLVICTYLVIAIQISLSKLYELKIASIDKTSSSILQVSESELVSKELFNCSYRYIRVMSGGLLPLSFCLKMQNSC